MAVLQAKLLERRRQEEQAKMDALKGDDGGSWGNQMRSYVLHPYQMVKDLRTELRDRQHRGRARRRDRRVHRGRHPLAPPGRLRVSTGAVIMDFRAEAGREPHPAP